MVTEEKLIKIEDEKNLSCEILESGSPVWIIATHGLGEHKKRHRYLFDLFSQHFNILIQT